MLTTKERCARQKASGSSWSISSSRVRQLDWPSMRVTTLIAPSSMEAKQISRWSTSSRRFCARTTTLPEVGLGGRGRVHLLSTSFSSASSAGVGGGGLPVGGGDAGADLFDGLEDALAVEGLQQVVDGVDLEGADGVLVEGGGEDDLGQRSSCRAAS
jgi:hypothetical protein